MTTIVTKSSSNSIKDNRLSFWLETSVPNFKVLLEVEPFNNPSNKWDSRVNWNINKEGTFTLYKVNNQSDSIETTIDKRRLEEIIKAKGAIADLPQYSSYPNDIKRYIADYIFTDNLIIN